MNIYQFDGSFRTRGFHIIAGIDEAGRGPLAGPVVASAVVLRENSSIEGLRDSKKVPEKEREFLFREILSSSAAIGVGIVDHDEIDRLNILNATKLAMRKSLDDLVETPDLVIIDAVSLPSLPIEQVSFFKAESKSASVAAASIVAKFVRDSIMLHYDELYPLYNFKKHKGYCTKEHMSLIETHGPCPIHRKSFHRVMSQGLPFFSGVGV